MYNLEDLSPVPVDFSLFAGENEVKLTFRPFVLADESWLKREFPEAELKRIFEEFDMPYIAKIGFHQLTLESKRKLMDIKFVDIDEDGQEFETAKKGTDKILMMLGSFKSQIDFIKFLIETRGASFPIFKEMVEDLEKEVKKKMSSKEKRN
jgi:hypothetical protein